MHGAVVTLATTATQVEGHLLHGRAVGLWGQISGCCGDHQIGAVVEHHRHAHGPFHLGPRCVAHGEGQARERQQHREAGHPHQAEADPPTQQKAQQGQHQQGRSGDPQPFAGREQKRISAHWGSGARIMAFILRPPQLQRATGPPSRFPSRSLSLTGAVLMGSLGAGLLAWWGLDRGAAQLYPSLRPWLERQVGRAMGHPLRLGPYTGLRPWGVTSGPGRFLPGPDNPSSIDAAAVAVSLDPLRSLVERAWVLQIHVRDAQVQLRRNSRGSYWELGRLPPGRPAPPLVLRISLQGPARVQLHPAAGRPLALRIDADTDVHLRRREVQLAALVRPAVGGALRVGLRAQWQRRQWQLQLTPRALPLQPLVPLLPAAVQQQVRDRLSGELQGQLVLRQGQACQGQLLISKVRWRGAVLPAPLQADRLRLRCDQRLLRLDPSALAMGPWRGQLSGRFSLAGPDREQLALTLQARESVRDHRLLARLQGHWRRPRLDLEGRHQGPPGPAAGARPVLATASLDLRFQARPSVQLTRLQLRRADARLVASGRLWPRLDVRSQELRVGRELLRPLQPLLGAAPDPRGQLHLQGTWQQPSLSASLDQPATPLLGPLHAELRWRPGLLRLERLSGPELSASGELPLLPAATGGFRTGDLSLSFDLRRYRLERLPGLPGSGLRGELQAWGEVRGPLAALRPDLQLRLVRPGIGPVLLEETWQGQLRASGHGGVDLELRPQLAVADGQFLAQFNRRWQPQQLTLQRADGALSLRGTPRRYLWRARRFPLAGISVALAPGWPQQPLHGRVSGQGNLDLQPLVVAGSATVQQPQLLGLTGRDLRLSGSLRARRYALEAQWHGPRAAAVDLRLRGAQGGSFWSRLEARQLTPALIQPLQLAWQRARDRQPPPGGRAADLGSLLIPAAGTTLNDQLAALLAAQERRRLDVAAREAGGRSVTDLDGRVDLALTLAGPRLDRLSIDLDARGQLWWREQDLDRPIADAPVTARLQGPLWQGRGSFSLQNLPLSLLTLFTPVPEGLRGGLAVQGTYAPGRRRDQPQLTAGIALVNGALRDQPLALERGSLALNAGVLDLDLSLRGAAAASSVDLRGQIPLHPDQKGLELRLASRGDGLRFLSVLAGPGLRWQKGSADLQLLVRGSQSEPVANGFLRLRQGLLQLAGQTLRDVEATVLFDFSELELQQLSAQVGTAGVLSGSGQLPLFTAGTDVPRLLRLQLRQVPFSVPRMTAQADGEILVSGALRRPVLGGELRLSRGSINVQPGQLASEAEPERPVTVRQLLDERWDFSRPLVVMGQQLESTASRDLRETVPNLPFLALSDLRLRLGPDLRVTVPNVLNFNTGGLLTLNGSLDPTIRATGVVRLLNGRLGLFTTNFSLDPDSPNVAVFTPGLGLIPYLDIALRTRVSDTLTGSATAAGPDLNSPGNLNANTTFSSVDQLRLVKVRLEATGPADRLAQNIRLTSSPPLPPERLVALIGGNSLVGLVAGNAGSALATVLGQSLLSPLVGGLSDAFGQRLSFALYPTYFAPAAVEPATTYAGTNRVGRLPSQLVLGSEIGLDLTERFNFSVLAAPNRSDIPSQMTLRYQASDRLGLQTSIDTEGRWQSQLQLFFRF